MQSKSREPHTLADLNNVQQTDLGDMNEHCIPFDIPYLVSP